MLIYQIPHVTAETITYVCDSQATIDAVPTKNAPLIDKSSCMVGTQDDANNLLTQYQTALLSSQASIFTVNLQTTDENGIKWTIVDLSSEPENTDRQYFVLDPTTGQYTEAIGLDNAKTLFLQMQQKYLVFTKMNQYSTMTAWPTLQT